MSRTEIIVAMHTHKLLEKIDHDQKNMDHSMNEYRCSKDAQRLNAATRGEALAHMNGLYISMADGFQSHNSKTQSITGNFTVVMIASMLLIVCFSSLSLSLSHNIFFTLFISHFFADAVNEAFVVDASVA